MRRLSCIPLLCALAACGDPVPYYDDPAFRRAALLASLVNPDNGYSRLRLAEYAAGPRSWDGLPEWDPAAEPVPAADLDRPGGAPAGPLSAAARPLSWGDPVMQGDPAALRALGEEAFFRYPVQLAPVAAIALRSRASAAAYGFWIDEARGAGGLVRVSLPGGPAFSYTCATCHAAPRAGALAIGDGNDRLDLGRLSADAGVRPGEVARTWGPGRLDVTTLDGSEPVRIPDLRPVRYLSYLHHDATVAQRDLVSLAIRLETLLITSHGAVVRPPRPIALALAVYVRSLADALPPPPPVPAIFAARCAGCHAPPGFTGPPVLLEVIGTDPRIGRSPDRGTGTYRVPSLRGVGTRGLLLHDASLSSLDALFDPARTGPAYEGGPRPGPVPGHRYGLDLQGADRAALIHFLQGL